LAEADGLTKGGQPGRIFLIVLLYFVYNTIRPDTKTQYVMRIIYLAFFILLKSLSSYAQDVQDFKVDFNKALDENFSEEELNGIFEKYAEIITPHSDITRLTAGLKGEAIDIYPLNKFKKEKLYTDNINKLINSSNSNQRILAYLVIAASDDISQESNLLSKIVSEKEKGNLIWAGMALLYLKTNHTTALFDFLVENEDFGDAHMLPLYVLLDKDSLQQTAYLRIDNENVKARVLAAQILSQTQLNSKTEVLLKKAVREWDIQIKGYAIYSIKELRIGDLLETFRPFIDDPQLQGIIYEALANSPTMADRAYLLDLVGKQDTVSTKLLNCFLDSKNVENIKYWIKLLYSKAIPKKYYFSFTHQPLIYSDSILGDLQIALEKINDPDILSGLVRSLEHRRDDRSTSILTGFLNNENETVRYWAAFTLKGNHSSLLVGKLPKLIKNVSTRTVAITDLLIENNVDSLQTVFEDIYKTDKTLEWRRSSIEYLANFPKAYDRDIFRKILQDENEDSFIKRDAASGLGKLKDRTSIDLIVTECRQECAGSDFNAQPFLVALAMIKGPEAKG
jgi:hypothetical protein